MKNKNLIFQAFVPIPGFWSDEELAMKTKLAEDSSSFAKEYADRVGADYCFEREQKIPDMEPSHHTRFFHAFRATAPDWDDYDFVLYLDSDVIVKRDAPDIFEKGTDPLNQFFACREIVDYEAFLAKKMVWKKQGWLRDHAYAYRFYNKWEQYFNAGMFMAGKRARRLLWDSHRYVRANPRHIEAPVERGLGPVNMHGIQHDQPIFNSIVHNSDLDFCPLSWKWNAFHGMRPGVIWGCSTGETEREIDFHEAYFLHYVGQSKKFWDGEIPS